MQTLLGQSCIFVKIEGHRVQIEWTHLKCIGQIARKMNLNPSKCIACSALEMREIDLSRLKCSARIALVMREIDLDRLKCIAR